MPTNVRRSTTAPGAPEVLSITGPAGAGKTVVADQWARTRSYPCANISLDDVRSMIRSGYADPLDGWAPEHSRQYRLTRGSVALLAHRFIGAGFRCLIDDAISPNWPVIDNSRLSVSQTVQAIEAVLGESQRDLGGMTSNKPAQDVP